MLDLIYKSETSIRRIYGRPGDPVRLRGGGARRIAHGLRDSEIHEEDDHA